MRAPLLALLLSLAARAPAAAESGAPCGYAALTELRREAATPDGWTEAVSGRRVDRSWHVSADDGAPEFSRTGSVHVMNVVAPAPEVGLGVAVRFRVMGPTQFFALVQLVDLSTKTLMNVGVDQTQSAVVVQYAESGRGGAPYVHTVYTPASNLTADTAVVAHARNGTLAVYVNGELVRLERGFRAVASASVRVYVGGGVRNTILSDAVISDVVVFGGGGAALDPSAPLAAAPADADACFSPPPDPPACAAPADAGEGVVFSAPFGYATGSVWEAGATPLLRAPGATLGGEVTFLVDANKRSADAIAGGGAVLGVGDAAANYTASLAYDGAFIWLAVNGEPRGAATARLSGTLNTTRAGKIASSACFPVD